MRITVCAHVIELTSCQCQWNVAIVSLPRQWSDCLRHLPPASPGGTRKNPLQFFRRHRVPVLIWVGDLSEWACQLTCCSASRIPLTDETQSCSPCGSADTLKCLRMHTAAWFIPHSIHRASWQCILHRIDKCDSPRYRVLWQCDLLHWIHYMHISRFHLSAKEVHRAWRVPHGCCLEATLVIKKYFIRITALRSDQRKGHCFLIRSVLIAFPFLSIYSCWLKIIVVNCLFQLLRFIVILLNTGVSPCFPLINSWLCFMFTPIFELNDEWWGINISCPCL